VTAAARGRRVVAGVVLVRMDDGAEIPIRAGF